MGELLTASPDSQPSQGNASLRSGIERWRTAVHSSKIPTPLGTPVSFTKKHLLSSQMATIIVTLTRAGDVTATVFDSPYGKTAVLWEGSTPSVLQVTHLPLGEDREGKIKATIPADRQVAVVEGTDLAHKPEALVTWLAGFMIGPDSEQPSNSEPVALRRERPSRAPARKRGRPKKMPQAS
ncbi:MAG TPA: hypothetical protein VFQ63_01770 [Patescibacteria group bacterium]|nr:hypothetical protein [Patescibacteria group bacterium]